MPLFFSASTRKPGPRAAGQTNRKRQLSAVQGLQSIASAVGKGNPVLPSGATLSPAEGRPAASSTSLHLHAEIEMMRRVIQRLFSEADDCQDSESLSKLLNALGLASVRVANLLRLEAQLSSAETSAFSSYQSQINQALAQVVQELRSGQESSALEDST